MGQRNAVILHFPVFESEEGLYSVACLQRETIKQLGAVIVEGINLYKLAADLLGVRAAGFFRSVWFSQNVVACDPGPG